MTLARKKSIIKSKIWKDHACGSVPCSKCTMAQSMVDKMAEASIPAGYWLLGLKDLVISERLKQTVEEYIDKIEENYLHGVSICFSGNQGTGKTLSSTILLKAAIKKNFTAFYITASDILNEMTNSHSAAVLRPKLKESDFLVVDELDSRFFVSDSVKELFSGIYENLFRHRAHNNLPTIICTNETGNLLNVFYGPAVQSIESLNNQYLKIYPVAGKDFRKAK